VTKRGSIGENSGNPRLNKKKLKPQELSSDHNRSNDYIQMARTCGTTRWPGGCASELIDALKKATACHLVCVGVR
jgi:hypothetical protein